MAVLSLCCLQTQFNFGLSLMIMSLLGAVVESSLERRDWDGCAKFCVADCSSTKQQVG